MKKNLPLLLVLFLLCAYAFLVFQKPEFTPKGPPTNQDLSAFIDFSRRICLFIGAGLFTILTLGSPRENRNEVKQLSSRVWLSGVFSILSITTVSVLIFNPIGAFTWNTSRVAHRDARLVKPQLYNQLNPAPDIVFLGTSISYRIPAQKYAQKFSLTGFNFSVLGGTTVDYSTITNFIVSESTPDEKPAVLVTEVLSPGLLPSHNGIKYYKRYPIEYAAYMPPQFAFETIATHLDEIFTFSSFSLFIYVEYFIQRKQWNEIINLKPDGAGASAHPITKKSTYKKIIAGNGEEINKLLRCANLDADGQGLISKMVAWGRENHIGMVFYRSPINDDFYPVLQKKPAFYKPCEEKFNRFMEKLQTENPNVFYVDLSHYAPISSGGKALYMDSHHLNSVGSDRLLEVLTPVIQKAIEYARSR